MKKFNICTSFCLALIVAFVNGPALQALSREGFYRENEILYYNHQDLAVACTNDASGPLSLVGSDNQEKAFNFFISKGLTPFQSAGIVGNLIVESGGPQLDPTVKQFSGGPGRGIVQWEVGGRWDTTEPNMLDFAAENGMDPLTLEAQVAFLWHELQTSEKRAFDALKATTNVDEAASQFMLKFERPRDQSRAKQLGRVELAEGVLARYGNGTAGAGTTSTTLAGCAAGTGGAGIVDGFAFPLQTTKKAIRDNNPAWCYTNQNNCHHDYNAADIMISPGTVVLAAMPGEVAQTVEGVASNITIKGDDGRVFYYQHLAQDLRVQKGQKVTAGQPIGTVGDRAAAWNTAPHLHFDILPPEFTGRVGCSAAGCNRFPFENVQPQLIKSFEALPEDESDNV